MRVEKSGNEGLGFDVPPSKCDAPEAGMTGETIAVSDRSCLHRDHSPKRRAEARSRCPHRGPARIAVPAILGVVAALLSGGCGSSALKPSGSGKSGEASFFTGGTPGGTPVRGGRVVIDQAEVPTTMDPVSSVVTGNNDAVLQVAEGLVETVSGSKEVRPALASSWTISPDGLTYVFHIRPGVEFSNGEPLTGEDVVYTMEHRWRLPTASFGSFISPHIKKVFSLGPMTVEMQMKQPYPAILADMAFAPLAIVSKNAVEREGEQKFAQHPVGTGPFMVKSVSRGYSTVVMVPNPHYWRHGQPYIRELVWNQVVDANTRVLNVRSGAATIDLGPPFSQVGALQSTPGVRLLIEPLASSSSAFFNDAVAPFNELAVRKALNYATPRQAIINSVFKGLGTPANNFPTNQFKYWDSSVPSFPYDIAKAKSLLRKSKFPGGFTTSIMIYGGEPNSELIASILQNAWAKIGVHLNVQSVEPGTWYPNLLSGKYQVALFTPELIVAENYEPDLQSSYEVGASGTGSYYKSPRVTALVEKATSTQSDAIRNKLFRKIQYIVNWEEAAFLPIAFAAQLSLVSDSLRGFTYPPNSYFRMSQVWLQK